MAISINTARLIFRSTAGWIMPENDREAIAEIIRTNGNYALPNEEISGGWSSEEQPPAYYRTTAARARRLQADVTTPKVKQYLDKMIVHCDRLAGKAEQPASRPLDRPAASTNPGERSVHRLVQFRIAE